MACQLNRHMAILACKVRFLSRLPTDSLNMALLLRQAMKHLRLAIQLRLHQQCHSKESKA